MIIKIVFCLSCSLCIVPALSGMHKFKKEKNPNQGQNQEQKPAKITIEHPGDKDKLLEARAQYRTRKHTGFAEEHNPDKK